MTVIKRSPKRDRQKAIVKKRSPKRDRQKAIIQKRSPKSDHPKAIVKKHSSKRDRQNQGTQKTYLVKWLLHKNKAVKCCNFHNSGEMLRPEKENIITDKLEKEKWWKHHLWSPIRPNALSCRLPPPLVIRSCVLYTSRLIPWKKQIYMRSMHNPDQS